MLDFLGAYGDFYVSAITVWWSVSSKEERNYCKLIEKLWTRGFDERTQEKILIYLRSSVPEERIEEVKKHALILFTSGKVTCSSHPTNGAVPASTLAPSHI
jgi:hypothetical protein